VIKAQIAAAALNMGSGQCSNQLYLSAFYYIAVDTARGLLLVSYGLYQAGE